MEYFIGIFLGVSTPAVAQIIGFDRSRNFYPVVLIVIASYYVLFAVGVESPLVLWSEVFIFGLFVLSAVIGFRYSLWVVVAGLIAHGLLDAVHDSIIQNSGVPHWWPGFCLGFDVAIGIYAAVRIIAGGTARARVHSEVRARLETDTSSGSASARQPRND